MKQILIVDDEPFILNSFRRYFGREGYNVLTAISAKDAFEILKENHVDVVISDYMMPEINGIQFLEKVKEEYPNIFRIILSGFAEKEHIIWAIRNNIAKVYIMKPWNNDIVSELLSNIFDTNERITSISIKKIFDDIINLPTIESKYMNILNALDKNMDIKMLVEVIERDPAISVKVLHLANSVAFGLKTGSIKNAVVFLGIKNIKQIILSTGIIDLLSKNSKDNEYLKKLWDHSYLTNRLVICIYENILGKMPKDDYLSVGLLHNVGMLLMLYIYKEKYMDLLKKDFGEKSLIEMEKSCFDLDHGILGGIFLRWIGIPSCGVEAAIYHHNIESTNITNKEIVDVIHIAQYFAGEEYGLNKGISLEKGVLEEYRVEPEKMTQCCKKICNQM